MRKHNAVNGNRDKEEVVITLLPDYLFKQKEGETANEYAQLIP